MIYIYSTILFLFFQVPVTNSTIDSLTEKMRAASGKEKVILLNDLYKQYANNDPARALDFTHQALMLAQEINDASGVASSYNNMGVVFKNRGDMDAALEYYIKALRIQEKNKYIDALAYTYSNIGTVYSLKGEYSKALEYFNKANDQFVSINHKLRIIGSLSNIGNVYEAQGHYDEALEYYLKSLAIYGEIEDNSNAFVPFNNIGNIYFIKREYESAMAYYESSLDLEKFNNDLNGQANALRNIGNVYKAWGKYEQALEVFNEGLSIVQETSNKRLMALLYESIAEIHFVQGDMFLAYSFLRLNNVAKDSLFSEESSRRIAELEGAYELEKKENEINSLRMESQLQQLTIKNNNIYILAGVIISILGIGLTLVIFKEYRLIRRNKLLLEEQNGKLEQQKLVIEDKNLSITESIDYAKSVQKSLLNFPISPEKQNKSFILFIPKDIVSGDFFWYAEVGDIDIVAAIDCTGHGVAGAFMTVIGISSLDQIINRDKIYDPSQILEQLNLHVRKALKQRENTDTSHGMDVAICQVNNTKREVVFAGANRPLFYFKAGRFCEAKGNARNIGEDAFDNNKEGFDNHNIKFDAGDSFYLASDGYADQFGGNKGKKFMLGRFKALLREIQPLPIHQQKKVLGQTIRDWKGDHEQTDDIVVLGFKL